MSHWHPTIIIVFDLQMQFSNLRDVFRSFNIDGLKEMLIKDELNRIGIFCTFNGKYKSKSDLSSTVYNRENFNFIIMITCITDLVKIRL